jgi:hypothetical protein
MHSRTSSIQSPAEDGAAALRGRRGLRTSSPPQFGHTPFNALAQVAQNVHS